MEELLFLVHRIPYPPNKGDKIRSYHLFRYLTRHYRVHLGAFIDDPADWKHVDVLRPRCGETRFVPLNPGRARLRSLRGFLKGQPLTLPYYDDPELHEWVADLLKRHPIRRVLVFSSAMAQYVEGALNEGLQGVIDFVDVDSDKWEQYSKAKSWPMNWLYHRESRYLLEYERRLAESFTASLFVSGDEAEHFRRLAPEVAHKVGHFNNGVDTDYFTPDAEYENPYPIGERVLVFTGAMDYWANVDAVAWFAKEIFPLVREKIPDARFYIVGTRPDETVRQLGQLPGVVVTGRVVDVRPYLAFAAAAVAPLRIARGVQNKVLEAMAMARPVIMTPAAVEGIELLPEMKPQVSGDPQRLAEMCVSVLQAGDDLAGDKQARRCVLENYRWERNLAHVGDLLEPGDAISPEVSGE